MIIRNETVSDIEAISEVTIAAFQNLAVSNHTEQFIINALRNANAMTISLVAEVDGQVVGDKCQDIGNPSLRVKSVMTWVTQNLSYRV